jgi:hypothetical protein
MMSRKRASESSPLSFAVPIGEHIAAARSPPRSEAGS